MGIGTSLGAFFEDEHHYHSAQWDPEKYDQDKAMVVTPNERMTNQALDEAELNPSTGMGIEIGLKEDDKVLQFLKNLEANPKTANMLKEIPYIGKPYNSNYDTKLLPSDEEKYQNLYGPNASQDYDMRGYFKANPDVKPNDTGVHYPDTFKKPNHPTFSMDSKYNLVDGHVGGVWGEEDGVDTFKPSETTNLKNMTKEELQGYFKRVEPKAKLLLGDPDIEDRRDDTKIETYQEILDGQAKGGTYMSSDNKELDKPYTKLEKEAGLQDLDKTELNQLISSIRGAAVK